MLNADAFTGQRAIVDFILNRSLATLRLLNRQRTLLMEILNPLIALVLYAFGIRMEVNPRSLKHFGIVLLTGAKENV